MRASRAADEIGVVVHGPEVVDSGRAREALDRLERIGSVTAVLGGTMGRVAVIDAALEDRIDISRRETPSRSVQRLMPSVDAVVLLNYAKTAETGLAFGAMVAERAKPHKPLILAEYSGPFASVLAGGAGGIAERIAGALGFPMVAAPQPPGMTASSGRTVTRTIFGAVPGENVSVNGIVIGRAEEERVTISATDGRIVQVLGAEVKEHGLEKIPSVDLEAAILRTGDVRRTEASARRVREPGRDAVLIDHAAEGTFEAARGAGVAVTVGDDTTAIAGEVLARLGIPLVGIVDGDLDMLCPRTVAPKGSYILRVRPGSDDLVGRRVREEVFGGGDRISMEGLDNEDLVDLVKRAAGEDLRSLRRL